MSRRRVDRATRLLRVAEQAADGEDWPTVQRAADEALPLCRAEGWDSGVAMAFGLLSRSCQILGRFPDADRHAAAFVTWARARGGGLRLARALAHRGEGATFTGKHLAACEFLREALDILAALPDEDDTATASWGASSQLGSALMHLGRFAEAEQAQELAYELALRRGQLTQAALAASQLALITAHQGLPERALEYALESHRLAPGAAGVVAAELNGNRALALSLLGHHEEAEQAIELTLRLAAESPLLLRQALLIAAEVADRAGSSTDALAVIDVLLERLTGPDQRLQADLLNRRGLVKLRLGRPREAMADLERSVELRRALADRDPRALAVGLSMRARGWLEAGEAAAAQSDADEAASLWNSLLDEATADADDAVASGLFEKHALLVHQPQLEILLRTGAAERAVEASERSRGGPLTRLLLAARPERASRPSHPPDLPRMQAVAAHLDATLVVLGTQFGLSSAGADPRLCAVHAWVLRPQGTVTHRELWTQTDEPAEPSAAQPSPDVAAAIAGLGDELSRPGVLREFGESLVDPIADLLPEAEGSRLIILPQRALWAVPFAALTTADGSAMIDRYEIGIAPSVHALELLAADRRRNPTGAALVVGGVHGARRPQLEGGFAELDDLVHSEEEARRVAHRYATAPLLGRRATVRAVSDALPTATVVHIASHAIQDAAPRMDRPPGIVALTPTDNDDGQLTSDMVLALGPLDARLVVLSSCGSAHGRISQDGVRGMVRSFLGAGAESVVASLWPVGDHPALVQLMDRLHAEVARGHRPAAALRCAALDVREDYDDPRLWAAFQCYGLS